MFSWLKKKPEKLTGREVNRTVIWAIINNQFPDLDWDNVNIKQHTYIIPYEPEKLMMLPDTWEKDWSEYNQPCEQSAKHFMGYLAEHGYGEHAIYRVKIEGKPTNHRVMGVVKKSRLLLFDQQTQRWIKNYNLIGIRD